MKMNDEDLMCLYDGEADSADVARLRARLAAEPGAATKLEFLRQLGDATRADLEAHMDGDVDGGALWARIVPELASAVPPPRASWIARYQGHLASAFGGALVAAALLAVWLRPDLVDAPKQAQVSTTRSPTASGPPVPQFVPAVAAPVVESLDVPAGSGAVFTVQDEEGGAAVIWISPDDLGEPL